MGNFSRFFIERPIFASVIAIIIALAGIIAGFNLPISQYPEISPPTVTITTVYPGASAETIATTVAAPIEEQLSGAEGMVYFQSSASSDGTLTIVATRSNDILLVVALDSPQGSRPTTFLADYAAVNMVEDLKRIPGVGDVFLFGAGSSMRVWLHPDKMARLGVTPTDVSQAILSQNAQYAAGKIGGEPAPAGQPVTMTVTVRGRLARVEEFENIVIRA